MPHATQVLSNNLVSVVDGSKPATPPHIMPVSKGGRPMPPKVTLHKGPIGTHLQMVAEKAAGPTEKAARTADATLPHIMPVSRGGRPTPPEVALQEGPIGTTSENFGIEPTDENSGIEPVGTPDRKEIGGACKIR